MAIVTVDEAVSRLHQLACDAAESGLPLLESGIRLLLRAKRLNVSQQSCLAIAGQMILAAIHDRRDGGWRVVASPPLADVPPTDESGGSER